MKRITNNGSEVGYCSIVGDVKKLLTKQKKDKKPLQIKVNINYSSHHTFQKIIGIFHQMITTDWQTFFQPSSTPPAALYTISL